MINTLPYNPYILIAVITGLGLALIITTDHKAFREAVKIYLKQRKITLEEERIKREKKANIK